MAAKSHGKSRRKTPWDHIQDYMNLFAFVRNPPYAPLEKVEKLLNLAFSNPKMLRYRDQFGVTKGLPEK